MDLLKRGAALAVLWIITPRELWAQATGPGLSDADRIQRLEQRLDSLDQHYQEELKKRDEEIRSLRQELKQTQEVPSTPLERSREQAMHDLTKDILNDIETRKK